MLLMPHTAHPSAILWLSEKCYHSPRPRASKLTVPSSRLAEVLMLHERCASVPSEPTPKYTLSISPPIWSVVSLLHQLKCDPHGRAKWETLPDSYLSTCAYSILCCSVTAIAQCCACKTRPRSIASYDLQSSYVDMLVCTRSSLRSFLTHLCTYNL